MYYNGFRFTTKRQKKKSVRQDLFNYDGTACVDPDDANQLRWHGWAAVCLMKMATNLKLRSDFVTTIEEIKGRADKRTVPSSAIEPLPIQPLAAEPLPIELPVDSDSDIDMDLDGSDSDYDGNSNEAILEEDDQVVPPPKPAFQAVRNLHSPPERQFLAEIPSLSSYISPVSKSVVNTWGGKRTSKRHRVSFKKAISGRRHTKKANRQHAYRKEKIAKYRDRAADFGTPTMLHL